MLVVRHLVPRRNGDDTVGIHLEADFDLRNTARRRGNPHQLEARKRSVAIRDLAFALKDVDFHHSLIVGYGRKREALLGRDRCVSLEDLGEETTARLDSERQGNDVEKNEILDLARQHATLNRSPDGDDFVRVDLDRRLLAEDVAHAPNDDRRSRLATYEQDLVDVGSLQLRIPQGLLARLNCSLDEIEDQLLKLRPRECLVEVLRTGGIGRDERKVDMRLGRRRKLALRTLRGFLQTLQCKPVLTKVDSSLGLELGDHPIDDPLIEILTAEEAVAAGGEHLEHAVIHLQDRDIERASAEVEDRDFLGFSTSQSICEGRRRGLIDDPLDVESGDLAGVLRRLALDIVEIGGNGNDRFGDFVAQKILRGGLQTLKQDCGNLRRTVVARANTNANVAVRGLGNLVRTEVDGSLNLG